jgi:hypothetical protein
MSETLYATFSDYKMAEKAVGALLDHGLNKDAVTLIANNSGDHESHAEHGITTTTGADAAAGAAKGAGIGLAVGALGALASLLIPGFGLVTGGGALATALGAAAGTTAGGAAAGGLAGFLQDQGVDEAAALDYEAAVKRGGALVELHLPSGDIGSVQAEQILNKYNATNIRRGGTGLSGSTGTAAGSIAGSSMGTTMPAGNTTSGTVGSTGTGYTSFNDYDTEFQSDYQTRFSGARWQGRSYNEFQPAYSYGYELANDSRFRDRDWMSIENDARSGWKHQSAWEDMKDAVRHSYDRVRTGMRTRG